MEDKLIILFIIISLISWNVYITVGLAYIGMQYYTGKYLMKKSNVFFQMASFLLLTSIVETIRIFKSTGKVLILLPMYSTIVLALVITYTSSITLEDIGIGIIYTLSYFELENILFQNWIIYKEDKNMIYRILTNE